MKLQRMRHHAVNGGVAARVSVPAVYRRGFTLLEALMAAGILLVAVIAVTSAVTAGQHHAYEAQLRIAGAIAAEELLGRLHTIDYDDLVGDWDDFEEAPGEMETMQGSNYPKAFDRIGRRVTIIDPVAYVLPGLNVNVHGLTVQVQAFDDRGETLVTLSRFVPQPQYASVPGASTVRELEDSDYVRTRLEDADLRPNDSDDTLEPLGISGTSSSNLVLPSK